MKPRPIQIAVVALAALGLALSSACAAIRPQPTVAATLPPSSTLAPVPALSQSPEPVEGGAEGATAAPTSTPVPKPALSGAEGATPTTPPTILFSDDFSDPGSGWKRREGGIGLADYADDAYRIRLDESSTSVRASPGLDFADVRVEVDVSQTSGLDQVYYGIVCRYQDEGNFYAFVITGDRGSGIFKLKAGEFSSIGGDNWRYDAAISPRGEDNHLRADCVGDTLVLYINDRILAYERDTDLASGDVGLIAGAVNSPGVEVVFDNFVVFQKAEVALSTAEESQIEARGMVDEGWRLVQSGQVQAAVEAYELAQKLDPTLELRPADWNQLCWYGSLWEQAAEVMFACERAVALAPDDASIRDSRGLARALTGDYAGAVEDFRAYVEWSRQAGAYEAAGREREAWIAILEAGINPFDSQTLEDLRNE